MSIDAETALAVCAVIAVLNAVCAVACCALYLKALRRARNLADANANLRRMLLARSGIGSVP